MGTTMLRPVMVPAMVRATRRVWDKGNDPEGNTEPPSLMARMIEFMSLGGAASAWYDLNANGVLFQDTAGTMPVTNLEQPVGLVVDVSGKGNHLVAVSEAARPTLRLDNGKLYLYLDGTTHQMKSTTNAAVVREDMLVGAAGLTEQFGTSNNQLFGVYGTSAQYIGVWHRGAVESVSARIRANAIGTTELGVRGVNTKYTALAWMQDGGINGRLDGGTTQSLAYAVTVPAASVNFTLAAHPAGSYRQRFYGGLVFDDATNAGQRDLVVEWLNATSGFGTAT